MEEKEKEKERDREKDDLPPFKTPAPRPSSSVVTATGATATSTKPPIKSITSNVPPSAVKTKTPSTKNRDALRKELAALQTPARPKPAPKASNGNFVERIIIWINCIHPLKRLLYQTGCVKDLSSPEIIY